MSLSSERSKALRQRRQEQGLCVRCGRTNPSAVWCCSFCKARRNSWMSKQREKGFCTLCGTNLAKIGKFCERCKDGRENYDQDIKRSAMEHYGQGKCACCKNDFLPHLTLDHVNNDGKAHRASLRGWERGGICLYKKLKREGYPNNPPLQVLCFNCNMAKKYYGVCPCQVK